MTLKEKIARLAKAYKDEITGIRRHLHANPELSYKEYETCAFVEDELQKIGLKAEKMGGTGVVSIIEGKNPDSRVIALRADLDALPITEENDLAYKDDLNQLFK